MEPKHFFKERKLIPPPNITKENLGIWNGWTFKSDREVAREAGAKGHVHLAMEFLCLKKGISVDEAKSFIKDEISIWVNELLERKQIFRVSHILKNIDVNPVPELVKVFRNTNKKDLRDYIGGYLQKSGHLTEDMKNLWHFLDVILKNSIFTVRSRLREDSIHCLDEKTHIWKNEMACKLILRTQDLHLLPFFNAEVLWEQLLMYNDIDLLKAWIIVTYSKEDCDSLSISQPLFKLFQSFPVTLKMLNKVMDSDCSLHIRDHVLNEFARFGIFCESEVHSLISVSRRVGAADNIAHIGQILNNKHSNLPFDKYMVLFVDYCLDKGLVTVLNNSTRNFDLTAIAMEKRSIDLDLMVELRKLAPYFNETSLHDNILNVAKYLSGNIETYFCDNPILMLGLLIFSKNLSVTDVMSQKSLVVGDAQLFGALDIKYKIFSNIYNKWVGGMKHNLNYYDLMRKHLNIDIGTLFSFRFSGGSMPHFNDPRMVEKYGYSKKVNYIFYLTQCRPSIAYRRFKLSEKVVAKRLKTLRKKVLKTAIMKINDIEVTSSCIAFLEMIGVSSDYLRVCVHSAEMLLNSGVELETVMSLFLKIDQDPKSVLDLIEWVIVEAIEFKSLCSGSNFLNAVSDYEIVHKLCVLSNLPLPELFLKRCAYENLWLPFLLYAQMKNYPIPQVKALVAYFKNPNVSEHIVHSVIHDIHVEEPSTIMKERDSRKYYLSRIGVRKNIESGSDSLDLLSYSKSESSFSLSSGHSSSTSDSIEIDVSNVKTTLLHTLIRCHNSTDPPRALLQACQLYRHPFLAIVATCYEPDSVITSWIAWLSVATNQYEIFTNFEALTMSGELVGDLLRSSIKSGFPQTLLESLLIFIPENPLRYFMEFLIAAIRIEHPEQQKQKLELFRDSKKQRRGSVMSEKEYEMTYIKNKTWLENTSLKLLACALEFNTNSTYHQETIVETLGDIKFEKYCNVSCPDFYRLSQILKILFGTKIKLDMCRYFDAETQKSALEDVLNGLLKENLFEAALEIGRCSNIVTDTIVLKKWRWKFENRDPSNLGFFYECDREFAEQNISPQTAVEFFMERITSNDSKYVLLKLSHKWSKIYNLSSQYELEKKKILAFVAVPDYFGDINELTELDNVKNLTFKEMLELVDNIETRSEKLPDEHSAKIGELINRALDRGNFWLALRVEKIFNYSSADMDVLKCCHKLAEKMIGLDQLDADQKKMLSSFTYYHKIAERGSRKASETDCCDYSKEPQNSGNGSSSRNILSAMHCLIEKLEHGIDLAHSILMLYRMSINIEVPYYVVVSCTDQMKMLKDALDDDCMNKVEVVHDFIMVFRWSNEQISDLFCEEIVNATLKYVKSKTEDFILWNVDVHTQFHLILKLLKDESSCLAYKLYSYSNALYKAQLSMELDFKISELALIVELLIIAHNCFTADCNMEGISSVLRKCRSVVAHLVTLRSWKLIVRLFIGIARYSEMDYVFQILKEHDQFEFLLRKGSRRDDALKDALLEYLRRFCPDNKELFKMVALHFTLYSEVADLWEQESEILIQNLIAIAKLDMENNRLNPETEPYILFPNDSSTRRCLNKLMENYTHATEFHMQGEKLTRAMNAVKQAELIALQKSLFRSSMPNAQCLFHLSNSQVVSLISKELSCAQSRILVEAYNFQPDWASILFEQCIIRTNSTYLEEFMGVYPFGETLVQDISRKFINANINKPNEIRNMKNIVRQLVSVHAKYRIASELGFTDVVEDLLVNGQLAYLKDTVWKKGFKGGS
ncbi:spatacsin [Cylas formicarius]|uniref:spatacsin n=1 Tax=Cylas formicarius TaxID=197179 RepID=UPI00295898A3|nr:spatacsin [Cylas formicarius]